MGKGNTLVNSENDMEFTVMQHLNPGKDEDQTLTVNEQPNNVILMHDFLRLNSESSPAHYLFHLTSHIISQSVFIRTPVCPT